MLRITPIGSCRVAGPLQQSQNRLGYAVNKARSYGYCHSSGEAVQLVRFMQGDFTPPADIWPLIARGVDYDGLSQQVHDPSEIYIVELSSAKRITLDDVFIQLNYLTNAYRDLLGDPTIARGYWDAVSTADQGLIDAYLNAYAPLTDDHEILRRVRMSQTTLAELSDDIQTLQSLLPRVLFVTHVNARKPDGSCLTTRAAFIDMVKTAARQQGARVYDPTIAMHEMGDTPAIADHSTGLAHYTDAFAAELADDWDRIIIQPTLRDLKNDALTAPHIAACLERNALQDIDARIVELATRPTSDRLLLDTDIAHSHAATSFDALQGKTDETSLKAFASAAFALERFDDLAAALRKIETHETSRQLLHMARAALDAKNPVAAVSILETLLKIDPKHSVASSLLADVLLAGEGSLATNISAKTSTALLANVDVRTRLQLCDARGWTSALVPEALSTDDLVDVIAHLTLKHDVLGAATLIVQWQALNNGALPAPILPMLDKWCASACACDNRLGTLRTLNAVLSVHPKHNTARDALRNMRRDLRDDMRSAAAQSDRVRLSALADQNDLLPSPLKELDLYRARERFDAGAFQDAIDIGLHAARAMPSKISVWVLLMRAAYRGGDHTALRQFASRVASLADEKTARLKAEADGHLARLAPLTSEAAT